ncbi:MAG: VanW family protein [Firmicutes bacterium]|nr:VanW family protein [Bacillota bacterium]
MEANDLKSGWVYAILLLLALILVGGNYVYYNFIHSERFLPGVEIGGIPVQGYDREQATEALKISLAAVYKVRVTFDKDDFKQETTLGDLCTPVDAAKIVEAVWQEDATRGWQAKLSNLNGQQKIVYPVPLAYDQTVQTRLVQEWDAVWDRPAQDAALEIDSQQGLIVVPGHSGLKVDADKTFQALPSQMGKRIAVQIPIILQELQPKVTADMLQNMGELAHYSTYYNTGEVNRSHNLALAAAHINKMVIAPHTNFSVNDTVGERTGGNGFLDAKIIVGDKFELGLGGGVCQVSSTLYNAVLLAGLQIVERGNHNLAVAYVPLGLDATVYYGVQDFRFKNNTDSAVYIRAVTYGGQLTINIYGNIRDKKQVELSHVVDQTLDFTTVVETDVSLQPGEQKVDHNGQPGYVVRSFRTFYDKQGNIINKELLARDTYQPLNKLILQGPAGGSSSWLNPIVY